MMKKLVSLLLALVMALGLCTSAIAETNGESEDVQTGNETYTMETVLAGVDALTLEDVAESERDAAKEAAKNFLQTNFAVVKNNGKFFLVITDVRFRYDLFFVTEGDKTRVKGIVDNYEAPIANGSKTTIKAVLNSYIVQYGNNCGRTDGVDFGWLMNIYKAAAERLVLQSTETGKVQGIDKLRINGGEDSTYPYKNGEYIKGDGPNSTAQDMANSAVTYFKKYFKCGTETFNEETRGTVTYNKDIYENNSFKNRDKAQQAITDYNNLSPMAQIYLNELEIYQDGGPGVGPRGISFWQLIQQYNEQLNGSQGGGNNPGGPPPSTGNVTDVSNLPGNGQPNEEAKVFFGPEWVYGVYLYERIRKRYIL